MTAVVIPFERPRAAGARSRESGPMLAFAAEIFPLLELAYRGLGMGETATAEACLDELHETTPEPSAPSCAIEWRDRHAELLAESIMLVAALRDEPKSEKDIAR